MKKYFVLSAFVAMALFTACNKQEIDDDLIPGVEESPVQLAVEKANNANSNNAGEAIFSIADEDKIINEKDDLLLINNSVDAISYLWDFGNGDTSTKEVPEYKYEIHGNYTVSLTVIDANGAIHQAKDDIVVLCLFGGGDHDE